MYTHRIEIYTPSLLLCGSYDLPIYRRLSDAINGEQRRYIPLRDASIAPLERMQQAQRVPHLMADRSAALLVVGVAEARPPSGYLREGLIREVGPITAVFFTSAFVVRATFRKRPDLSLAEALDRSTDDFVPLRDVQVFPLVGSFAPIARDFAAIARTRIVAFYQAADAPVSPAPPAPPADARSGPPGTGELRPEGQA